MGSGGRYVLKFLEGVVDVVFNGDVNIAFGVV